MDARKSQFQLNTEAMKRPGYANYKQGIQGYGLTPQQAPNYADKFANQFNPVDIMSQLYGGTGSGGSGSYGPIGADELKEFGKGAYELFDKFKPGMEHIAENQGVDEQELANQLGTASSGYAQNLANAEAQQQRQYGRMGIDPTSGAYAAGEGSRTIQSAAELSGLQQNVRQNARNQDWSQRMQAAGIGLNTAGQGTDALGRAAGAYGDAASNIAGMYGDYMSNYGQMMGLDENARQFGANNQLATNQFLASAVPNFTDVQSTQYGNSLWQNASGPNQASNNPQQSKVRGSVISSY